MRNVDDNVSTSIKHPPVLKLLDCSLRLSVIPLSVASIWLTVTNKQDNSIYGKLEFSNLMGLKYMVCISAISAGYALVAAVSSWVRCLVTKAWLFFVSDQVLPLIPSWVFPIPTKLNFFLFLVAIFVVGAHQRWSRLMHQVVAYLMVTSGVAVFEILYLAYNGDREVTWSEACSSYGRFCSRLKLALGLHALALCCFLVLAVISAYRVFSMFEPPSVPSKELEEERN